MTTCHRDILTPRRKHLLPVALFARNRITVTTVLGWIVWLHGPNDVFASYFVTGVFKLPNISTSHTVKRFLVKPIFCNAWKKTFLSSSRVFFFFQLSTLHFIFCSFTTLFIAPHNNNSSSFFQFHHWEYNFSPFLTKPPSQKTSMSRLHHRKRVHLVLSISSSLAKCWIALINAQ